MQQGETKIMSISNFKIDKVWYIHSVVHSTVVKVDMLTVCFQQG